MKIHELTWVNQFQVDHNLFIKEFGDEGARMKDKLYSYCSQGHVPFYELHTLRCSKNKKLWYAAIIIAVEYDNLHKFVSDCGEPNMLYSLIREYPDNLKGV